MSETQKHKFQTAVSPLKREHFVPSKLMGVKFSQYGGDEGNVSFAFRQSTFRLDYEDDVSSVHPSSEHFPIRLRKMTFRVCTLRQSTFRLDYER